MEFYNITLKQVYKELDADQKGLTSKEAASRLEKYGKNRFESKKGISPIILFLSQFNDPVIWILIAAAVISAFLGEMIDFYVIFSILMINAIIGFIQEYKAEKAIEALKKMASLKAIVLRDGKKVEVDSEELVIGDYVFLTAGEKVPADIRLISLNDLHAQEAALTGESVPVSKEITEYKTKKELGDQKNMVFSGTILTSGKAEGIVVRTGMQTEIGRIAKLIDDAKKDMTPLQENLEKLGKFLTYLVLGVCAIVFGVLFYREHNFLEALKIAASLAVAAIPEGLPAVVTVSLAIGVKRMIKKNALVRKLPSVETLGSTTVICTDKTGTLTKNEMTVKTLYVDDTFVDVSGTGYDPKGEFSKKTETMDLLLKIGILNNDAKLEKDNAGFKIIGDPTEGALIVSAKKAGFSHSDINEEFPRIDEILFTSERKRMTTVHRDGKALFSYMKGAPDIVLEQCTDIMIDGKKRKITRSDKEKILKANEKLSSSALRVLGFAYKELQKESKETYEKDMVFVGLQGMIDPPREEVKEAIKKCKTAGIRVIMITGDHMGTAAAIAKELGIEGKAVSGKDLQKIDLDDEVEDIGIYARVDPEHKMMVVNALKKKGHVVAMTGDGVNDAPALKSSDIGIAMGIAGTDVSKESADMILTDDNFASIVNAVEEGRGIYGNIRKYFSFLLSGNIAEILIITINVVLGLPLPLTATQILFINLVTDGLPAVALSADPFEPNALERKPRKKGERIYKGLGAFIITYPLIVTAVSFSIFSWFYFGQNDILKAHTGVFLAISMSELYQAFACRSTIYPAFKVGIAKNKYLLLAVISSMSLLFALLAFEPLRKIFELVPLTFTEFIALMALSSLGAVAIEISKAMKSKDMA